jgi:diadenosine tetraphosphate (Ap4A) HIT family hydrolase
VDVDSDPLVILTVERWVLIPTVGCFTPGYSLFLPIDHVQSIAEVGHEQLEQVALWAEEIRHIVVGEYGPTVIGEQGSTQMDLGAGSVPHAHLHVVPVPDCASVAAAYHAVGGPGRSLHGLSELSEVADGPYMYLSPRPGAHFFWPADAFPRQFLRRTCASTVGLEEYFDWPDHPFTENQLVTRDALWPKFVSAVERGEASRVFRAAAPKRPSTFLSE